MVSSTSLILVIIVVYLLAMVLVGAYFSSRGSGSSSSEFFIGGRKLGPIVTAMSAEASDMSSYLLMGLPGLAYFAGVAEVGWTVIGLAAGTYLNWLLVARLLRRYSDEIAAFTIPNFFSRRYGDKQNLLGLIAALVIIIFFVPYTASGFKAVGTLFNTLFGFDYHISMLVGAVIIIGYTTLGGFMAVSTTDLIQSIFMSVALIVVVFFGIGQAGGMGAVMENAASLPGYLDLGAGYDMATNSAGSFGFLPVVSTLAWGLGYFGMPHILLRFMAIRREEELNMSRRIASVWVVFSMAIAVFIGIIGNAMSRAGLIPYLTTGSDAETIVIKIADLMGKHGLFFILMAGIIMAGILAATMSTADSQLLAAASSVSQDLLQDFAHVKLSRKASMHAARLTVIGIAVIAVFLAWDPNSSVFRVISFAWAGFGATFGPTMLLALFWRRSNRQGALAGMIVGAVMVFVWKFLIAPLGGALAIYELLPAFIFGLIANVVVSRLTAEPEDFILETFDKVHKN